MPTRDPSEILEEISRKLDRLMALVACQGKTIHTQIRVLTEAGLSSDEIGNLIGMSGEAVRMRRSRSRKQKGSQ